MKKFIQTHFTFWEPIALAIVLIAISVAAEWVFGLIVSLSLLIWFVNMFITTGYFWDKDKR